VEDDVAPFIDSKAANLDEKWSLLCTKFQNGRFNLTGVDIPRKQFQLQAM